MLDEALAAVADIGGGRTVLVLGEAGIGKTALLREFCDGVAGSARVLWVACDHLFTPRPLGPFLDLAKTAGGQLAAWMGDGVRPYDVAAALLAELGSGGTAVVVLEDLHWADEASLDVIRLLFRRIEALPALVILSYRDDELDRSHPLRLVLGDLSGGGRVTRVELAGLSPSAVATLARPLGLDAGELHARTGGNPFFVTEVLAAGTGRIPRTVRDAVLARAALLGPAAGELLDAAAVIPGRGELWLLDKLVPAAADSLDACLGSGILVLADGWVAFRHEIARLVVEESLLLADRYIQPGLAFCRERGLDIWQGMLTTLAAEAALARGRWDEADSTAATILAWPAQGFAHMRAAALVISARLRARRGEPGCWPLLDEAAQIAKAAPVMLSALQIAATRAEAAWLEGAPAARMDKEIGAPAEPGRPDARWWTGELEVWRHRAGLNCGDPAGLPEPYRLEITGDAGAAARWWQERGCEYEAALALAGSGDPAALRRALDVLHRLDARPAATVMARRLRALGEQGVPRGPRPATAANPARLTRREAEVLQLLAAGLSNAKIAARLGLSGRTVDNHVSAILRKLGVRTREEAGARAERLA